jgi:hypothetical protein
MARSRMLIRKLQNGLRNVNVRRGLMMACSSVAIMVGINALPI